MPISFARLVVGCTLSFAIFLCNAQTQILSNGPAAQQKILGFNDKETSNFPESLCYVQNFESIEIVETKIVSLPGCFGNFGLTARLLRIDKNPSMQEIPDWIGLFKATESIAITGNGVTEISTELGNLVQLGSLNLSGNKLRSIPENIGNLSRLTALQLQKNPISQLPNSMAKLNRLESLDLSGTALTKTPLFLPYLVNLTILKLPASLSASEKFAAQLIFKDNKNITITYE